MKHFIDIENLREEDTELRQGNGKGFEVGDIISITEKVDGSNCSIMYDSDSETLLAFSRKQKLTINKTLQGFWDFAQSLGVKPFAEHPSWIIFGEWNGTNKIRYLPEFTKIWIVYDIFDTETEKWLSQSVVKMWCEQYGFRYINELYYGEFISWDHCKTFLHSPAYGDRQEGIVVKNQTKLNNPESRLPFYLKIVNEDFKESMKTREKVIDPEAEAAKAEALQIVESIVTRNRVEKELFKMRDEGIVPAKIEPSDMKIVASYLPKRIYEDCMKEEKELVLAAGDYFSKMCSSVTMKHARDIILG